MDGKDYNSSDFARLFDMWFGTGVSKGYINDLKVSPYFGNTMQTIISPGAATIMGKGYINDEAFLLTHDTAHATLDRIDRVVIQMNLATRKMELLVKKAYQQDFQYLQVYSRMIYGGEVELFMRLALHRFV